MRKECFNCKYHAVRYDKSPCNECTYGKDAPKFWEAGRNYVPDTNADRIRAMTDEELAKILDAFTEYFQECNRSTADVNCEDCELCELCSLGEGKALKWLQQPAEEAITAWNKRYTESEIDFDYGAED